MSEGELDILITRVIDGRAEGEDWRRLESLAERDAGVWRELAQAQRDDQVLRREVASATAGAGTVELELEGHEPTFRLTRQVGERTRRVAMWGGWAAAALVAVAFVAKKPDQPGPMIAGPTGSVSSAADFLSRYLDQGRKEGRVIHEMPDKVLVNTIPAADGKGYDVVFLRVIMERDRVPDLYRFTSDESGQPVPIRVHIPATSTPAPKRGPL
ncbi:MAG: hypothetical protein HBSAPP03_09310 [Phycisphaerae bacterium]|nr:MAG: hypothetical protein HBSAPP03_09310 [Phycisphaerae bacterium]